MFGLCNSLKYSVASDPANCNNTDLPDTGSTGLSPDVSEPGSGGKKQAEIRPGRKQRSAKKTKQGSLGGPYTKEFAKIEELTNTVWRDELGHIFRDKAMTEYQRNDEGLRKYIKKLIAFPWDADYVRAYYELVSGVHNPVEAHDFMVQNIEMLRSLVPT